MATIMKNDNGDYDSALVIAFIALAVSMLAVIIAMAKEVGGLAR